MKVQITADLIAAYPMQRCLDCKQMMQRDAFAVNRSVPSGLERCCRACMRIRRASAPQCAEPGCKNPKKARGRCDTHNWRIEKYGDPNFLERFNRDPNVRFWSKVEVGHPAGCWWWMGTRNEGGYGKCFHGYRGRGGQLAVLAHRFAYEALVGPIPDGLHLDHLCRNTSCINPDHLEPVTPKINMLRTPTANKTHCKRGHPRDERNTYRYPRTGGRQCRACRREVRRKGSEFAPVEVES